MKPFCHRSRSYFSKKHVHGGFKIILIEKEKNNTNTSEIVEEETLSVNNGGITKAFKKHL